MKPFNLTPTPEVLVALTHTSMKPIDALCELVDNAIDSFSDANARGSSIDAQTINIVLPTTTDIRDWGGLISVRDNGPGMSPKAAEDALRAGYSSHNPYGSLGLFGMGINIATGKFARKTRFITAEKDATHATVVEVDLPELVRQRKFEVTPRKEEKAAYFESSGTMLQMEGWWPEGNPNRDFPRKLVQLGPGKVREILGRRYASLLQGRSPRFTIHISSGSRGQSELCVPFEHCVWSEKRSVRRHGNLVPARIDFDQVVHQQRRCLECNAIVEGGVCEVNASHRIQTVPERIWGWIGVQRYDNDSHYGVDLIRNGRAIRVLEKDAFFKFTDDFGKETVDYPIDSPFGRIVGVVHLDHVPVAFTKQNFSRESEEWRRAMEFLRGKSSLQAKRPGASENKSPMMQIFSAYRRVRKCGRDDLYMAEIGFDKKIGRIDRKVEEEFLNRFNRREPGYYDDAKWWEKVDVSPPDEGLTECSHCRGQIPAESEICGLCSAILKPANCVACGKKIARSAENCTHCGKSQIPEGPWNCQVCGFSGNSPDADKCRGCESKKGAVDPLDARILEENSKSLEDLSTPDLSIYYANRSRSDSMNVEVREASLRNSGASAPAVSFFDAGTRKLLIFIDKSHPAYASAEIQPEHVVAAETAFILHGEAPASLRSGAYKNRHNLTSLQWAVIEKCWGASLSDILVNVRKDIESMLDNVREMIEISLRDIAEEIFESVSIEDVNGMIARMREASIDIANMGELKASGKFLLYVPPQAIVMIFRSHPERFFDRKVWTDAWNVPGIAEEVVRGTREQLREIYLNCLEDCVGFLRYRTPPAVVVRRARLSCEFLMQRIAD